jgi:hypothetical protein
MDVEVRDKELMVKSEKCGKGETCKQDRDVFNTALHLQNPDQARRIKRRGGGIRRDVKKRRDGSEHGVKVKAEK